MIVVDSSALIAIYFDEAEKASFGYALFKGDDFALTDLKRAL